MSVSIARWMVMVMPIELLPQPLRWWARRVRTFCLSDGVALLVLGLGIIARGVSYVPAAQGRSVSHPAEGALPMSVWAIIWIGVGVVCLVAAVWHDSAVAAVALGLGVGLNLLWAGSFIAASVDGTMSRGWVSAVGYLSVAVLVLWSTWRGSRLTTMREEDGGGVSV